jgi:hypothetical protein
MPAYIYYLMAQFFSPFTSITAHPRVELACCSSMRRGCGCIKYVVVENNGLLNRSAHAHFTLKGVSCDGDILF